MIKRLEIRLDGIVQGIGFRPFVHNLANRLGLGGHVSNDARGVIIEAEGDAPALDRFTALLGREAPELAMIINVTTRELAISGEREFVISASHTGMERAAFIAPDLATCQACIDEMLDPSDRRFRYAFINCTHCGPRYTIVIDVPYDRARTTMAGFEMCADCRREYLDPLDRRFHAQPVACPACGPKLTLFAAVSGAEAGAGAGAMEAGDPILPPRRSTEAGDPILEAARRLERGEVLAIKGLGGYHLAAHAENDEAVARLRARKHREEKPFALMAPDLETARRLVRLNSAEEKLLTSARRPILLVERDPNARIARAVAPGNRDLGIMLPYTPVHHLLARELRAPIVLTSGNLSDEPIAYRDDDARSALAEIADAFLVNDRPIHIRTDDSVYRVVGGKTMPLRRSRGFAPQPVRLPIAGHPHILACGGELKSTICVAKGGFAFLSHHIGDLENAAAHRSFVEAIAHLSRMFDVRPEVIAHDLHPDYLSTKWAFDHDDGARLLGVQHHHAHLASCLADNGEGGPVIGVVFDGLGYGTDETWWGGEFFVADLKTFERAGHWSQVRMPGGVAAIHEPWRMAAAHLVHAYEEVPPLAVEARNRGRWRTIAGLARRGPFSPFTSSIGRLFDAVAAIIGTRDVVSYEGQAAIELEQHADPTETGSYPIDLVKSERTFLVPSEALIRAVVEDLNAGRRLPVIAARFHRAVADVVVVACEHLREQRGLDSVALSGGVFQNMLLLRTVIGLLEARRFRVLIHRQVPPNDGGISLGQAAIAAATARG